MKIECVSLFDVLLVDGVLQVRLSLVVLVAELRNHTQVLQVRQQALASTRPLLLVVRLVHNTRRVNFIADDRKLLDLLASEQVCRFWTHALHEAFNELQQKAHAFVELFIVVVVVELKPSLVVLTQANFAEGPTNVKLVSLKLIPHPVRQDTEKVNDLAHSCVDFVPTHFDSLRAAEPQTSNRRDLINSPNLENLVDKGGLI